MKKEKKESKENKNIYADEKDKGNLEVVQTKMELVDEHMEPETEQEKELRKKIVGLKDSIDEAYWEISEVLHAIKTNATYRKWEYNTFKEYCEKELKFTARKAEYLVSIWDYYSVKINDKSCIQKLKGLGWAKTKELINLITKDNMNEVLDKVFKMSLKEVINYAKEEKVKRITQDSTNYTGDDQVVEGDKSKKNKDKDSLHSMGFKLYPEQYKTCYEAIEKAKSMSNTESVSQAFEYVSSSFLATNDDVKDRKKNLIRAVKNLESVFQVKMAVVDIATKEIIYNNVETKKDEETKEEETKENK